MRGDAGGERAGEARTDAGPGRRNAGRTPLTQCIRMDGSDRPNARPIGLDQPNRLMTRRTAARGPAGAARACVRQRPLHSPGAGRRLARGADRPPPHGSTRRDRRRSPFRRTPRFIRLRAHRPRAALDTETAHVLSRLECARRNGAEPCVTPGAEAEKASLKAKPEGVVPLLSK